MALVGVCGREGYPPASAGLFTAFFRGSFGVGAWCWCQVVITTGPDTGPVCAPGSVMGQVLAEPAAITPRVQVRLNAMVAQISQAAFAGNRPLGRWASAEFFRSAMTRSMMA